MRVMHILICFLYALQYQVLAAESFPTSAEITAENSECSAGHHKLCCKHNSRHTGRLTIVPRRCVKYQKPSAYPKDSRMQKLCSNAQNVWCCEDFDDFATQNGFGIGIENCYLLMKLAGRQKELSKENHDHPVRVSVPIPETEPKVPDQSHIVAPIDIPSIREHLGI